MNNPTIEDRLEWTIADNVKKAIEIERLNKLVDDIAYTAKNRKKKMHKYRAALRDIGNWSQEIQDAAEKDGAGLAMYRGCVALANLALKDDK